MATQQNSSKTKQRIERNYLFGQHYSHFAIFLSANRRRWKEIVIINGTLLFRLFSFINKNFTHFFTAKICLGFTRKKERKKKRFLCQPMGFIFTSLVNAFKRSFNQNKMAKKIETKSKTIESSD